MDVFSPKPMRTTLLILAVLLGGCDGGTNTGTKTFEPDTRAAFVLDPSKPFVIELGRGSGWHGLDIVKVDETGAVQLSRIEGRPNAEVASLQLTKTDVATLVGLVNTNQMTSMGRTYSDPRIADGTQWVLWIEQSPSQKSIYFNNSFPSQITAYANGLDGLLQKAGLSAAKWNPSSAEQATAQQNALWAHIEPAR
jgi:hypothetical protein